MHVASPAWRSDLAINHSEIEIADHESHVVVRSRRRPSHIWKNFVLFSSNQGLVTLTDWLGIFAANFPQGGAYSSVAFGWDTDFPNFIFESALRAGGFAIDREIVLCTKEVRGSSVNKEIGVEPIGSESVWAEVVERRIGLLAVGRRPDLQAQFEREKFEIYRSLVREGVGAWFIAQRCGVPVADMGVFVTPEGIGRFQEVLVYPNYRGQGIAGKMVAEACEQIREIHDADYFLTVAQSSSIAASVYRGIGFECCGVQARAMKIAI